MSLAILGAAILNAFLIRFLFLRDCAVLLDASACNNRVFLAFRKSQVNAIAEASAIEPKLIRRESR